MTKLYYVTTVVNEYSGHKNVAFHWFFSGTRRSCLPYAELIADYDPDYEYSIYAEGAVYVFTEDEANQLKSYLDREHGEFGTTTIKAAKIPIPNNTMSYGATPVGGPQDFYQLHKQDRYELPFEVVGYFDLRHHEPIDKSVPARHQFCSVYIIDGRMISDYAELMELWRAGKIVARDEVPPRPLAKH